MVIFILIGLVGVGLLFIRLAPTVPETWHQPVTGAEDKDFAGGAIRVITATPDTFDKLYRIALRTPRTRQIAGDVGSGRVTFETRTRWIGFPDYTTIEETDGQIRLYARLRFGIRDLGVNRKRLEGWLRELGA